ncbi:MAG: hypothetical protein ABJC12_07310 [Saprospiraceae bacterium]
MRLKRYWLEAVIADLSCNRRGYGVPYITLMLTMLLSRLWYGANWTFVFWGGLHGFYLWVEKFIREKLRSRPPLDPAISVAGISATTNRSGAFFYALFTFFLINVTWVFFRASTFPQAWQMLGSMFGYSKGGEPLLTTLAITKVWVIVTLMVIVHWWMRDTSVLKLAYKVPWWVLSLAWALMLVGIILSQESTSSFIYFQF